MSESAGDHFHLAEYSPDPFGGGKIFPWCRVVRFDQVKTTDGPVVRRSVVVLDFLNGQAALRLASLLDLDPHVEVDSPKDIQRRLQAAGFVMA